METIQLARHQWHFDSRKMLGRAGGFGAVYQGTGAEYGPVAIKKLHFQANLHAHRELRIAEELAVRTYQYVIPILDCGFDENSQSYFIVMERADLSLEDEIRSAGSVSEEKAVGILYEIVSGLLEVDEIVHRDLKPGNVLYHCGKWKIADFGIARFFEESTSAATLKGCLSPQYAAPEQWNHERATHATDVYALGCIAVTLLTGTPPFQGSQDDLKHKHLHAGPPDLEFIGAALRSMILGMLRKSPDARPPLKAVSEFLRKMWHVNNDRPGSAGLASLSSASAGIAQRQAKAEANASLGIADAVSRDRLATEAKIVLTNEIVVTMLERFCLAAPTARRHGNGVRIGDAELLFNLLDRTIAKDEFVRSRWDIVAGASIYVIQGEPKYEWSASLWYGTVPNGEGNRWWEVAYWYLSFGKGDREFQPFALMDDRGRADEAAGPALAKYRIAFGPRAIDREMIDEFVTRWGGLLAKACKGELGRPRNLPLCDGDI